MKVSDELILLMFECRDAMAHQRCFVCGQTNADEIVQVTGLLEAHKNCFCGYQCRAVLNTGRYGALCFFRLSPAARN